VVDLRLTFGLVDEDDFDSETYQLRRVAGLSPEQANALALEARDLDPTAAVSLNRGSAGKGAEGPALQLVLQIAETVLNDGASVFAWGTVLWAIVKRVTLAPARRVDVQDPLTIGLLAAAADSRNRERLVGAYMGDVICLTGGGSGMGTDMRDVWLTPFVLPSGDVWAMFSATDGGILGEVTVPARWTAERGEISGARAAQLFRALNRRVLGS